MSKILRALLCLIVLSLTLADEALAHIGSPNIIYEGKAAGTSVRVIIKPPEVIPGLAEITVRTAGQPVEKITVLPVYWETGKKGSPTPDIAKPVRGETNLYTAALWFMKAGAYSVHVGVENGKEQTELVIPVNSLASVRREMPPALGIILVCLGILLFISFASIIGAAAIESTQAPGQTLTPPLRQKRLIWSAGATLFLLVALYGGSKWWAAEDDDYFSKRLSRDWPVTVSVGKDEDVPLLNLNFSVPSGQEREWSPLILDHGKWSHWFLIREKTSEVFVHLHPYKLGDRAFTAVLPPIPPGDYHLYADISLESGLYRTLQAKVKIPEAPEVWAKRWRRAMANPNDPLCGTAMYSTNRTEARRDLDADDTWHIETAPPTTASKEAVLMNGYKLVWDRPDQITANKDLSLRFHLKDKSGQPAKLEPYLGMNGHMVVRHDDGNVFAHVHPVGNISMASQAILTARSEQPKAKRFELLATAGNYPAPAQVVEAENEVRFPYAFPRAGTYRIWVQCKNQGQILTASFVTTVTGK